MTVRLFTYPSCPYCEKVRDAFTEMDIEYEEVNAERGTQGSEELVELGGKQQVPFLIVEDTKMYESDEIIEYAQGNLS
ncbi:MAG: glutaredoxin [Oceanicoccus sp.]|jgi:glutaredoxin